MRPTLPVAVALAHLLALTVAASPVAAQGLPFKVQVLDWEPATLARQMRSYRARADDRELLYCVEAWKVVPVSEEVERVVIERVRLAGSGGASRIGDVGEACLGRSGEPLPMIHTHTEGNCQFSPSDLVTVVARRAPFDGIQCGPQHFTWNFAWQVQAIASSVERARDRLTPY